MYALASFGLRHSALLRSRSSGAGHGDVSTQLIQIDCLSAYHGFFIHYLSAQVMMLVYGTWTTHSHSLTPSHTLTPPLPLTLSLHSLTHTHSPTRSLSLAHSPSLTHTPHSHHSLTVSLTHLCMHVHTHTHKLTHHHPSITLILPLPFLLFYAQSKSRQVGNMWGYPVLQ